MTDDLTFGGYLDKHERPPAFEGSDGESYSAEIYVDREPCDDGRFGAAVLFVRWSRDGTRPAGHLETEFLAFGRTPEEAGANLRPLTLYEVKERLDGLIEGRKGLADW